MNKESAKHHKPTKNILLDLCDKIEAHANIVPIYRKDGCADARSLVSTARRQALDLTDLDGRAVPVIDSSPEIVLRGFLAVALANGVPVVLTPQRPGESQISVTDRLMAVAREVGATVWYGDGKFRRISAGVTDTAVSIVDDDSNDTAYLQYSSGSVGRPRPLRISHRALTAQLDILAQTFGLRGDDVVSSWLPLSHDMGLIGGALLAMNMRLPLLLWTPQEFMAAPVPWVQQMAETNSTYFPVIPVGMHVITKAIESSGG